MSDKLTVIDFHSHILPALDHGCTGLDQCREQLALMKQSGTDIAVATSHFYPNEHAPTKFRSDVDNAISMIKEANINVSPRLAIGAEVLLCRNLHLMEGFDGLCIRGTNVLLLELPMKKLSHGYFDTVEQIIRGGTRVVLAHIDRYIRDYDEDIDTILSMGAYAQVNAYSLATGKIRKRIVEYLETTDKICALGSDLHGVDTQSYKKFVKAEKLLGEHYEPIMKRTASMLAGAEFII